MSGFAKKIFVAQLSITTFTISDLSNSSSDCVERIMAALFLRHVFKASTM